jgi:hypothetical protein
MNTLKTKHCHINSLSRSSKVAVYTDEDKKMNTNRNRTRTRTRPNLCINTPPAGKQSVWNLQISPLQLLPHSWSPPLPINSGPPPYQSTPAPQIMYATSPRNDTSRREGERERERGWRRRHLRSSGPWGWTLRRRARRGGGGHARRLPPTPST